MPPLSGVALLAAQRVFDAADRILNFASGLIGLAFGVQFGVAGDLANSLFHFAFYDLCRTGDAIFVHENSPSETPLPQNCEPVADGEVTPQMGKGSVGDRKIRPRQKWVNAIAPMDEG
jgi:hypothetical protein